MKKTQVIMIDDIDKSEAADTVSFSFKGVSYEIDLSAEHIAEMTEDFEKWISAGRRVGGRARRGTARPQGPSRSRLIREWAHERGIEVNDRGRIPTEIANAYDADQA